MPDRPKVFRRKAAPASRSGGSATLRDQSAAYQRLRLSILDDEPLCRYCFNRGHVTQADVLDHIIALSLGGTNDRSNLAPACTTCNAAKGKHETRYLRRGYDLASVRHDPDLAVWFKLAIRREA